MYNILITDDEQIVIDSLSFILTKNFPEEVKVFTANSGSKAVDICRQEKIDIVFMDISMPGLNGLDAIKEIKTFLPLAVVIILSAFDRFHYAQEAMALGAYRYLTKPVNRNLVVQTVRSALSLVDAGRGKLNTDIEMKEKLNFVANIVESDFIYSSVFARDVGRDLQSYLDYFGISETCYYFCVIELPDSSTRDKYETYVQVRELLTSRITCITGAFMMNRVTIFVPEEDALFQQETIKSLHTALAMKIGHGVRLGASRLQSDLKNTVTAYNEALSALNNTDLTGGWKCAADDDVSGTGDDSDVQAFLKGLERRLVSRVTAGDVTGTTLCIGQWFRSAEEAVAAGDMSLDMVRNNLFTALVNSRNLAVAVNKSFEDAATFASTFGTLASLQNVSAMESYATPLFADCALCRFESCSRSENPVVEKVRQYVQEHLGEQISLDDTAAQVKVNPYYLSKLFKDETGQNFIDYVTGIRMEKARELLRGNELSIKEISHETGYTDQNYFSKLFRRMYGLTPTEYRSSCQ
ncbi:MAG: response regulator [Treponemataceae bacterium]|nr:response regulator [Treponemataceae bacterium]